MIYTIEKHSALTYLWQSIFFCSFFFFFNFIWGGVGDGACNVFFFTIIFILFMHLIIIILRLVLDEIQIMSLHLNFIKIGCFSL